MDFDYMHMVGGKKPAGTIEITENGTHDVAEYATAEVNVEASGGDDDEITAFISGDLSGAYTNNTCEHVRAYAFRGFSKLTSVTMNSVRTIGSYVFDSSGVKIVNMKSLSSADSYAFQASNIEQIDLPSLIELSYGMFSNCKKLTTAVFRSATEISRYAINYCSSLKTVEILGGGAIYESAFNGSTNIEALIIRNESAITTLRSSSGISGCTNLTVYVPDELVDSYKTATNWSEISDRIRPLSEYVEEV